MTFRFFKSAASALLLGCVTLGAQTVPPPQVLPPPGATPAPEDKKPKVGFLRFWNMLPKETGELLLMQDGGPSQDTPLLTAATLNYYATYLDTKPGRYALKVIRSEDPTKTVLKNFDLILKKDVYVTFLARLVDGKPVIEMLDDTYDPEKEIAGKLVIRNVAPETTITVTSPALPIARPVAFGEESTVDKLPLKPTLFRMQAKMPDGKSRSWACEIDFKTCRHASLWLVLDSHGRFRPRMSPDGQTEIAFTEK